MFQFDNNLKSVKKNKEQQINRYERLGDFVPEARVKQVALHVASFDPFKRSIYKQ